MEIKHDINHIIYNLENLNSGQLLNTLLPQRDDSYSVEEVQKRLYMFRDEVEILQRKSNDTFDEIIDGNNTTKLKTLYQKIQDSQLEVLKLQCEIALTKEQYEAVNSIKYNPVVQQRRAMQVEEEQLRRSLKQLKFEPIKEFFAKFASYLDATISECQRLNSHYAADHMQLFDWTQYHQAILLLQACGKALIDVNKFEKLYQSELDIVSMSFKQPVNRMDFNNFIEFQETYSIESQLEITNKMNQRYELKDFPLFIYSDQSLTYSLFETDQTRLKAITVECCKLLINLNMNYIEPHLTDGINIDKLNGVENASLSPSMEDQNMPLYALSPQEYITQIGQHLLTLRKQTEQFEANSESLKYGLLSLEEAQSIFTNVKSYKTVTEIIMRCIARHCIRSLLGRTTASILSKLTQNGLRQLATDALYLDNVLEDLGLLDSNDPYVEKFKSLLVNG